MDRRITHTRSATGQIKRLTAAVLLDERTQVDAAGVAQPQPFTDDEMARFRALVAQAIGVDEQRGDIIELQTVAFAVPPFAMETAPAFWEQPGFITLMRQLLIFGLLALVVMFVVRPVIHQVMAKEPPPAEDNVLALKQDASEEKHHMLTDDQADREANGLAGLLLDDRFDESNDQMDARRRQVHVARLEERLQTAKVLVAEDPKRAVQVLRHWMSEAS